MTTIMQKKKGKILYIITKSNWGGAQRYVFDLATRLPKEDFEIAVAHGGNGILAERLRAAGIRTMPVKNFERNMRVFKDIAAFFELRSLLRRERPDVVHLNSSKAGGIGALSARLARMPRIVFTVHGLPSREPRSAPARLLIGIFSWLTVLLCHRVIAVCKRDRKTIAALPGMKKKVVLIYNGIERPAFLSRAEARMMLRGKIPDLAKDDARWVGTIGELNRNKGTSVLIEACALLGSASYRLIIVGDGEKRRGLEEAIEKRGLAGRAFIVSVPSDAALLLPAFDLFVLPSLKEGLPYTLLEAGAAGLPAVASAVGGIPEVIEQGVSGLVVPPSDAKTLAEALRALRAPKATDFGAALKRREGERFALAGMVKATAVVYGWE